MVCSISFAGIEVRLTGWPFPGSSSMSFLKTGDSFVFFQSSDTLRECWDIHRE